MLEPNVIVFYVDNLPVSSQFYQSLLGIKPDEHSPTFTSFSLSNGMGLALKTKDSVEPAVHTQSGGHGELAFTLNNRQQVDALFTTWQNQAIKIIQPPYLLPYGYTFVGIDPDGNRLRVVSLEKSSHQQEK